MNELKCRHCKRDNHPLWHKKYEGLCLDCSNAGVDEFEERIAALEAETAALREKHDKAYLILHRAVVAPLELAELAERVVQDNAALRAELAELKAQLKSERENLAYEIGDAIDNATSNMGDE